MLAESLIIDLNLNSEPFEQYNREPFNDRPYSYFEDTVPSERTLDERRAYLGILYIGYV